MTTSRRSTVIGRLQVPMAIANILPWTPIVDGQIFSGETLIQNQPYQGSTSGPNGTAGPKPYLIGVNRDEGALFADLANQAAGGITQSGYQEDLDIVFGTSAAAAIVDFTVGGARPYDPADQGTLPPWFASSPQAAAVSTLINDFVFRCGSFLSHRQRRRNTRREAGPRLPVRPGSHLQQRRLDRLRAFPRRSGMQNACHSFELPYVFNTLSSTNATLIPPANALLARRIARHWTNFARTSTPAQAGDPTAPPRHPADNNIEILSTGSAATGALRVTRGPYQPPPTAPPCGPPSPRSPAASPIRRIRWGRSSRRRRTDS